ncbi:uncharacterized protein LOC114302582 [Camellia sinensis]|uniref:uncharacterized protein LOC114302582 n=1 Tax=Camellia sinensis TaxID=4442 RepID=UPI001035A1D3|nr:uncharacterized protein LOC114302582 [Camellia sinensis]
MTVPREGERVFYFPQGHIEQVKMLIQRSTGALFGLLFSVWLLLELVDMQFTSTESRSISCKAYLSGAYLCNVELEKKIDEMIGQFIDRVEKHPSKKIDEKIGQFWIVFFS